jgi:uncharacterized membrane protein (DUF485 family)
MPEIPNDKAEKMKCRLGLLMFCIYAGVYASFVIISVYDVAIMDTLMPFGVNLAVFYGLGLIVLALILAVIYSKACTIIEKSVLPEQEAAKTEKKPLAVEGAEK